MLGTTAILQLLQRLEPGRERTLAEVAEQAGWSRFHLHRQFRQLVGETPKQYQRRLRLEAAAVALACTASSVADVAHAVGFGSHAGFTRAFRAQFGCSPADHRARCAGRWGPDAAGWTEQVGPCIGLFHLHQSRSAPMSIDVTVSHREPQPMLFYRRTVAPSELPSVLAECMPAVYMHCQQHGIAMAGPPFTRYPEPGRGLTTVEAGIPIVEAAPGEGDMMAGALDGGLVAMGVHQGPYEALPETHAAMQRWMVAEGYVSAGVPWESYVTDPADHPDPADWRTEVHWPVRKA